eukprot:SAG22_NODE_13626_length_400_cov_0.684385_2_plen_52_part_01
MVRAVPACRQELGERLAALADHFDAELQNNRGHTDAELGASRQAEAEGVRQR